MKKAIKMIVSYVVLIGELGGKSSATYYTNNYRNKDIVKSGL
jgi:hypothetical protein